MQAVKRLVSCRSSTPRRKRTSGRRVVDAESATLPQLCNYVVTCTVPYEDIAEHIENRCCDLCADNRQGKAIEYLLRLAAFFDGLECKSWENIRDQAMVYTLVGDVYRQWDHLAEAIGWLKKATVVDDGFAAAYHTLGLVYRKIGDLADAVKCFQREIDLAPENAYSYLQLAELFEKQKQFDEMTDCLQLLLQVDPDNVYALHRLILHHIKHSPGIDVSLLRRRLTGIKKGFKEGELIIWTSYLFRDHKFQPALDMLERRLAESPYMNTIHLLRACIYNKCRIFTLFGRELNRFKIKCNRNDRLMRRKLGEIAVIFGHRAVAPLRRRLFLDDTGADGSRPSL